MLWSFSEMIFLAETHLPLFTVMVDSKQDEEHLNFNSY